MKVTVVGAGYVGLVTGVCLADLGNEVLCLDVDARRVAGLQAGQSPIYEPGLDELIKRNVQAGRLQFSTDIAAAVAHGDIQFIAVGTPPDEDGAADLRYVLEAARNIGRHIDGFKVIVDKSTVPVGTAEQVRAVIAEELQARGVVQAFAVVSNPEFLKEGAAIEDFMRPDRVVIGIESSSEGLQAELLMRKLYAPFNRHRDRLQCMDLRSAELTKYAANAMLATRISFMNELANLADRLGADIDQVRRGMGSDPRIGPGFLYAGTGYGGSCFPKDVQALCRSAQSQGQSLRILSAVEAVNEAQKLVLVRKLSARLGDDLSGRRIAVWGLAFKPNTDDMREAPSRAIIRALLDAGAEVMAYDPVALEEALHAFDVDLAALPALRSRLHFTDQTYAALDAADALLIVTEWKVFRSPDFSVMKQRLKAPLVLDGRNLFEPDDMAALGFDYEGIGRLRSSLNLT